MLLARFNLDRSETVCLLVTFFVSGRWAQVGASEEQAREWVLKFVHSLNKHDSTTIGAVFLTMQNTLMAHRKDTFGRIQQEPPFSAFGLENMIQLDRAWVAGGNDGFRSEWRRIFAPGWNTRVPASRVITIRGGPGDSTKTAYIVDAPTTQSRVNAEYWYLYYTYGRRGRDWEAEIQYLTDGHDVLRIRLSDGTTKEIFFDRSCCEDNVATEDLRRRKDLRDIC